MSKFDSKYWYHELVECCAVQFMYTLFEKYIQVIINLRLIAFLDDINVPFLTFRMIKIHTWFMLFSNCSIHSRKLNVII